MRYRTILLLSLLLGFFSMKAYAQSTQIAPDCTIPFSFTAASARSPSSGFQNFSTKGQAACVVWVVSYESQGFTVISLRAESAPDTVVAGVHVPGTWVAFSGSILDGNAASATAGPGVNPNVDTNWGFTMLKGAPAWVSITLTSKTGSGTVTGALLGWRPHGSGDTASSGGCPAGATGAVQFNNAGVCGGDATNFFWDNTAKTLRVGTTGTTAIPANAPVGTLGANVVYSRNQPINIKAYGAVGNCVADDTAAIQAAYASVTAGGTVLWPQGCYNVTSTISVTVAGTQTMGMGQNYPATGLGTIITWAGAANGTVFSTVSCNGCIVRNLTIDGAGTAGRGLLIDSSNDATMETVRDVWIWNVQGTPGIALTVGNTNHPVTSSTFDHINIQNCVTGVLQIGTQSIKNTYTRMAISNFTSYAYDFTNGDITVTHSEMGSSLMGAIADIIVRDTTTWAVFIDNEHESSTVSYLFPSSTSRPYPTLIQGTRVLNINTNGLLVDYEQTGPFILVANTFTNLSSLNNTTVKIAVPGGGSAAYLQPDISQQNIFLNNAVLSISGNVDQSYTVTGILTASANIHANAGITVQNNESVLWGGSGHGFIDVTDLNVRVGFAKRLFVDSIGSHTLALIGDGAAPGVSTCGAIGTGSTNSAGFITSNVNGSCASTLTFNVTAPTGWSCGISNGTTANLIRQTGSNQTTATFTGVTVSGDVLRYACTAY